VSGRTSVDPKGVFINAPRRAIRELRASADVMKRESRASTIFHPHLFGRLAGAAANIARERGFLAP
jgi:hypothetical protein